MTAAVALTFLFAFTRPPMSNFWPLVFAAICAWTIAMLSIARADDPKGLRDELAQSLAAGLVLAGALAAVIGLLQFFWGDVGWSPWIYQSTLGQAIGNVRQRNQQATLLVMSALALVWWVARFHGPESDSPQGRRSAGLSVFAALTPWLLALFAMGSGATASRTGAMEWATLVVVLWFWRKSIGRTAFWVGVIGLLAYLFAAWLLPELLLRWTGVQMDGLFMRVTDTSHRCTSRVTLWSNMAHLISLKPWLGWGWGDLDYAHYNTPFPGERFCVLLDNAHNLPLHLAVELGLPVTLLLGAIVLGLVIYTQPWRETDASRQLAWGVLALIGVHSLLEFPLWYGPFQLVAGLAVVILCLPRTIVRPSVKTVQTVQVVLLTFCLAWIAGGCWIVSDYFRVSQLYQGPDARPAIYRHLTPQQAIKDTVFFRNPVEFAWLTTQKLTPANAQSMYDMAERLLHYSPEARVVIKLIESARLLGLDDEVAWHSERLRIAYPDAYKTFVAKQTGAGAASGQ